MPDGRVLGMIGSDKPFTEPPGGDVTNVPSLGRRVFRPGNVASLVLALVILYLVYREFLSLDWKETWTSVRAANMGLFALAFAILYSSLFFRALRWKVLLGNVGYGRATGLPMPSTLGLAKIMYLAWFANCVTVARLGDAYRGYLLKRSAGVSFAVTLGTVLAERLLDLLVLAVMMAVGVIIVFGEALPAEATRVLAVGLVLSIIGVVGLLSIRRFRGAIEWALPKRLHAHYARLEHGVVGSFRRIPLLIALSAIGWVLESATLYLVAAAVGVPVPVAGALVVALAASLLSTVPITPAGLGFTEAGLVAMLGWLGLDASAAGAATFLLRLINYWSVAILGFVLYTSYRSGNRLTEGRAGPHG